MFGRSRNNRTNDPNFSNNSGYAQRFGRYGVKGPARHLDTEPPEPTYGRSDDYPPQERRPQGYSDYSSFEGTSDRPYYGGEEGRFPFGGAPADMSQNASSSWNADERNYAGNWMRGTHAGKGPKGYRRSDERIREEVCEMLTRHGEIDASEIEVNVQEGIVQLVGSVESRQAKRLVEDLIDRVNGVEDIRNELTILKPGISPQWTGYPTVEGAQGSANTPRSSNVTSNKEESNSARGSQSSQKRMNS